MLSVNEELPTSSFTPIANNGSELTKTKISLPSLGKFYKDGKDSVLVSSFSVKQIKQLYSANLIKNEYEKEANLVATIGESVHDFNVYELTVGDFEFIKYWIRLNTYKKSPITLRWHYKLAGVEKEVVSTITESNMVVNQLESHSVVPKGYGYTTVRDYLDILKEDDGDGSYAYVANYATYLSGKTLKEKLSSFEKMDGADVIPDIREYASKFEHGVEEYVVVEDPEVGESTKAKIKLEIEISDFFP
jgi:hypothetical protein